MGQVCSGEKTESRKATAFGATEELIEFSDALAEEQLPSSHEPTPDSEPPSEDAEDLKMLREEQARLDLVVSTAGRGMVAVRSTRGSTGYYDQGFAAALAQHLEQTTQFPDKLEVRLPPPSTSSSDVYGRLNQPQWEGIALGSGGGLAGCGGENPDRYMDNVAESLLDSLVPAKQQLFAGVNPIVENLL